MKFKQRKFSNTDIDNVLFGNQVPETTIYPFYVSHVETLKRMLFVVRLDSRVLDGSHDASYSKLSKLIVGIQSSNVKPQEVLLCFGQIPVVISDMILLQIRKEYDRWQDFYYSSLAEYTSSKGSKFQWEIAQSIGIASIMASPFSIEQSAWIAYASSVYRFDEHKFTIDLFEAAKPWMNRELYAQVEKNKKSKRENVKFDEQKQKMLSGSFGLLEGDKEIIEKLEQEEQVEVGVDDLDIIR